MLMIIAVITMANNDIAIEIIALSLYDVYGTANVYHRISHCHNFWHRQSL